MSNTYENNLHTTIAVVSFVAGTFTASIGWWVAGHINERRKRSSSTGTNEEALSKEIDFRDYHEWVKNRIGELPSNLKKVARQRWQWDKITRSGGSNDINEEKANVDKANADQSNDIDSNERDNNSPESPEKSKQSETDQFEKDRGVCIGNIFGLDVGGTLAKLVYFERGENSDYSAQFVSHREKQYHQAASALAVLKERRGGGSSEHLPSRKVSERRRSNSLDGLEHYNNDNITRQEEKIGVKVSPTNNGNSGLLHMPHSYESEQDLKSLYLIRQESVPDRLDEYGKSIGNSLALDDELCGAEKTSANHFVSSGIVSSPEESVIIDDDIDNDNRNKNIISDETQRTISLPVGSSNTDGTNNSTSHNRKSHSGNMRRSRSMFDLGKSRDRAEALDRFYTFFRRFSSYETGVKDQHLSFYSRALGGEFHFIRFESRKMDNAIDLIRVNKFHLNISEVGATGGGAHKFADEFQRTLGINMLKQDELDSLVAGMQFVLSTVVGECYTFRPKQEPMDSRQNSKGSLASDATETMDNTTKSDSVEVATNNKVQCDECNNDKENSSAANISGDEEKEQRRPSSFDKKKTKVDEWWWSRKVQRDVVHGEYPYLLVTIGTGVSILRVDGPRKHVRVSGSTIGGGTYWGLMRLLTDVESFDEVLKLAERGDPSKVDMMVGDIYGKNSDALEKSGLSANLVASSFGKLVAKQNPASGIEQEDLARAMLLLVTNNIGQVAYLNAQLHKTRRIYFVGNFLRHNNISQQRLSFAIDYWSKGEMEGLFLEHEGYFGALGAFLLSRGISASEGGFHRRRQTCADLGETFAKEQQSLLQKSLQSDANISF